MKKFILDILYWILIAIVCIIAIPTAIIVMILTIIMCIILAPFALIVEAFNTK